MVWVAICLTALIYAHTGYQGGSDWKMEEGLAFEMMALAFPASILVALGLTLAGAALRLFGLALPAPSRSEMTVCWLLFVLAGYVQWFVLAPRLVMQWRKGHRGRIADD